jgi:hypothetical protein
VSFGASQSVISKSHIYPLTPLLHTCSATCYFRFSAICANGNEKVRSADAGSQENIQSVCLRLTNITGNEPGLPSNHVPTCARVRLTKSLNRPNPAHVTIHPHRTYTIPCTRCQSHRSPSGSDQGSPAGSDQGFAYFCFFCFRFFCLSRIEPACFLRLSRSTTISSSSCATRQTSQTDM